jgi:hypothetical protein
MTDYLAYRDRTRTAEAVGDIIFESRTPDICRPNGRG